MKQMHAPNPIGGVFATEQRKAALTDDTTSGKSIGGSV
jgi:hypothetical protein